jgi:hypothetical protein
MLPLTVLWGISIVLIPPCWCKHMGGRGARAYGEDDPWPWAQVLGVGVAGDALVDLRDADWGLCRPWAGEGSIDELLEGWRELRHGGLRGLVCVVMVWCGAEGVSVCAVSPQLGFAIGLARCHTLGFLWAAQIGYLGPWNVRVRKRIIHQD